MMSMPSSVFLLLFSTFTFSFLHQANARCECMNSIILLLRDTDYRFISSPDYPRYYCPSLNCSWKVVAPENNTLVKFHSNNLDLRQGKDFIYFYNHDNARPEVEPSDFAYSCTGSDECSFMSSGQYLTIRFVSDEGEPDRYGFQGTASVFSPYKQQMAALFKYKVAGAIGVTVFLVLIIGGSIFLYIRSRLKKRKPKNRELATQDKLLEK